MSISVAPSRRHFPRYSVELPAVLSSSFSGTPAAVECQLINLSRYGARIKAEDRGPNSALLDVGNRADLQVSFPGGSSALLNAAVVGKQHDGRELLCSVQFAFPRTGDRVRLFAFLKSLRSSEIADRRKGERRRDGRSRKDGWEPGRRKRQGIFADCESFSQRVEHWRRVYTFFRPTDAVGPARIVVGGRELISFGSKDYLGLSNHPRVKRAAHEALDRYGASSGSPVLNGTLRVHEDLENELAVFKSTEAAIFFAGGYLANIAILTGLLKPGDKVFLDEKAHASTFDGAIFGGATVTRFRHNSADDLRRKLKSGPLGRSLIIVDGVYSVEGDLGRLPELQSVAKEFGVPLMVDDAHGLGVMGTRGVGTAEHFGLLGTIDIEVGTGSTALGGVGGFLAGPRAVVDYLRHFSRGFLFTTSLPAATAAGLLEALRIIRDQPEVRVKLWENIHLLRRGLAELGYDVSTMEAAVVCLRVGHEEVTYQAVKALQDKGIYVNSFVRPAVKRGKSIIRLSVTAAHSVDDIHRTLEAFKDIKPAVDRERPISQE